MGGRESGRGGGGGGWGVEGEGRVSEDAPGIQQSGAYGSVRAHYKGNMFSIGRSGSTAASGLCCVCAFILLGRECESQMLSSLQMLIFSISVQ